MPLFGLIYGLVGKIGKLENIYHILKIGKTSLTRLGLQCQTPVKVKPLLLFFFFLCHGSLGLLTPETQPKAHE